MKRKKYVIPVCEVITAEENYGIMEVTSMPGQHEKPHHETGPSPIGGAKKWGDLWEDEKTSDDEDDEMDEDF